MWLYEAYDMEPEHDFFQKENFLVGGPVSGSLLLLWFDQTQKCPESGKKALFDLKDPLLKIISGFKNL